MPKYELMYILASSVSDDQVPVITEQVKKFVTDFGGTNLEETQLGKKKLAYPIKKTRNGYYVVVSFDMEGTKVNDFDAKIRAQTSSIIRCLGANLDEHCARLEKDKVAQSNLPHRPGEEEGASASFANAPEQKTTTPEPVKEKVAQPIVEMNAEELDKKIEEALTENLLK